MFGFERWVLRQGAAANHSLTEPLLRKVLYQRLGPNTRWIRNIGNHSLRGNLPSPQESRNDEKALPRNTRGIHPLGRDHCQGRISASLFDSRYQRVSAHVPAGSFGLDSGHPTGREEYCWPLRFWWCKSPPSNPNPKYASDPNRHLWKSNNGQSITARTTGSTPGHLTQTDSFSGKTRQRRQAISSRRLNPSAGGREIV